MNEEQLKKELLQEFRKYQRMIEHKTYGEFVKMTYFFLEKVKTYQGKYPEVDEYIKVIKEQVEIIKHQFSLDLDHEIQNKMRKGR